MDAPVAGGEKPDCDVRGCDRKADYQSRQDGAWLCGAHHQRRRHGRPMEAPLRPLRRNCAIGEKRFDRDGYVRIKVAAGGGNTKEIWPLEHRRLMEQWIGRPLLPEETVHHANGVKTDNRMENLELWSSSHPGGQRVQDKLAWAREIVALYGDWDQPELFPARVAG